MQVFTNENATVNALAEVGLSPEAEAWDDPLTYGRLAPDWDLDAYAEKRSQTLASFGWDEDGVLEMDMKLRNEALAKAWDGDEGLRLLFGSSLKDQLQLSQILCWTTFRDAERAESTRWSVLEGNLARYDGEALLGAARAAEPIGFESLELYRKVWMAVIASDPRHVETVWREAANQESRAALASALERWLREYPSVENGLSLTEHQALDAIRLGVSFPQEVFEAVEETEEIPFRRDWEFWQILKRLTLGERPLLRVESGQDFLCPPASLAWIQFHDQRLALTETGEAVLANACHAAECGLPERWLGGVRLDGRSRWHWDYARRRLTREPQIPV